MRTLIPEKLETVELSCKAFGVAETSVPDPLQALLIANAPCVVAFPDTLRLWMAGDRVRAWCRHCGEDGEFAIDVVDGPLVWWLVIAAEILAEHRSTFVTAEYALTPEHKQSLDLFQLAVRRMVQQAPADVTH